MRYRYFKDSLIGTLGHLLARWGKRIGVGSPGNLGKRREILLSLW